MKYLIKYDIPLHREDQLSSAAGTYGTKTVNGRVLVDEYETSVVKKMNSLRSEGYSYRQITNILNTLDTPPKKGKRWHLKVVYEILQKNS